ncbi:hypothetical protein ACJWRY_27830, partial [Klebsiella pneumoniae]
MAYQVARHRLWQKHKHSILNMDRASAGRAEHLAVSRRHVLPVPGLAPIFPYTFYHLTHDWFVAADIPV